jgi:CPA1 family monovalent cation:H+ antiporter
MIQNHLLLVLSLLFTISMLAILSSKVKVSYPIFLVIAGLAISLIPGLPEIRVEPDFVFLIFLPPLLYAAAWNTSWNDFWKYKRPIGLLGFGLVIFTSAAVAVFAHWLIPGFPIAYGFLLGGIISPPDAIAASSVLKDLKIPKRVNVILEGESLVNDAASLIVFRFALAAILTQEFAIFTTKLFHRRIDGHLVGLAIGYIIYGIHHYQHSRH